MSNKWKDISIFLIVLIGAVVLNVAGFYKYERFDLTADKRFTLTDSSVEFIKNLDDIVEFKVYLDGDNLPVKFVEFRNEIKNRLEEFRTINSSKIEYEFIDPSKTDNPNQFYKSLLDKGLKYTNAEEKTDNGVNQVYVFPGMLVYYKGNAYPLNLLKQEMPTSYIQVLNKSIQSLEYEITNAVRILTQKRRLNLGFLQGHNELGGLELKDISIALNEFYNVGPIEIKDSTGIEIVNALDVLHGLVIAKPMSTLTDKELYVIDQFIMKGGRVMWLIDRVRADLDSLRSSNFFPALPNDSVNVGDMLYKYGARINTDIVQDLQCGRIQLEVGVFGKQKKYESVSWMYDPVATSNNDHIINTNLDPVRFMFANSIDTIPVKGVKKTVLLSTSKNAKFLNAPVRVSFDASVNGVNPESFSDGPKPLVVLLEGKFPSYFTNKADKQLLNNPDFKFESISKKNKMIVIGDGDVIMNEITFDQQGRPNTYPLGADVKHHIYYDNKRFLLNAINYLMGDESSIHARSKKMEMRLLNKKLAKDNDVLLKFVNIGLPIIVILLFGLIYNFIRVKRFK